MAAAKVRPQWRRRPTARVMKLIKKKAHPKIRALLRAVDYDYQKAADYTGMSKSYVANLARAAAGRNLGKRAMVKVEEGLHRLKNGGPAPKRSRAALGGGDEDKGELGLAVVLVDPKQLEAIYDAGEQIGGRWVYKRRLGDQWLLLLRHEDNTKLAVFRALGRLGADVVTP